MAIRAGLTPMLILGGAPRGQGGLRWTRTVGVAASTGGRGAEGVAGPETAADSQNGRTGWTGTSKRIV